MKNTNQTIKEKISKTFSNNKTRKRLRISIGVIFFIVLFILTFISVLPKRYDVKLGQVATDDIIAPRRIIDTKMTSLLKKQAEEQTPNVYDYVTGVYSKVLSNVDMLFDEVQNLDEITDNSVNLINIKTTITLKKQDYNDILDLSLNNKGLLHSSIKEVYSKIYKQEVKSEELKLAKKSIVSFYENSSYNDEIKKLGTKIAKKGLKPNMILNKDASDTAKQNAVSAVEDIVYEPGEVIVKKGDVINANQMDLLKSAAIIREGFFYDLNSIEGLGLFIIMMIIIYMFYLKTFYNETFSDSKMLVIISGQFILMVLISHITSLFNIYLIPIAFVGMTICNVVNPRIALQTNTFTVIYLALTLGLDIDSVIYLILSGFLSVVFTAKLKRRNDIFSASIKIGFTNAIVIGFFAIYRNNITPTLITNMGYGLLNGVISGTLTVGALLSWESIFNLITPFKLLELTSPSNYLIKKLITDAPGTYHHSLQVANLAQGAAEEIGANDLLARAGAYYHDVGKLEKPLFFKENQPISINPHDHLDPNVSARIIKAHVNDGLYLANKYKLPHEIIDFIITHHGTTKMDFFYNKAEEMGIETNIKTYSYDGPRPKTVETALVLLADSTEAAVRSLKNPTKEDIDNMIVNIIDKKLSEGQLNDSPIKMEDIKKIKDSFSTILTSAYHQRIVYPGQQENVSDKDESNKNQEK